jgi:type IV pilus assembly protein PilW
MKRTSLAQPTRQRGITLVELMIGVTIGLFLVAAMGGIYLGSQSTFRAQGELARMQQNGRFAIDSIAADLRNANANGCQGFLASQTPTGNTAVVRVVSIGLPVGDPLSDYTGPALWGSRSGGGAWAPALGALTLTPAPDPAGDVLLVRRTVGPAWGLTADIDASDATPLAVSAGTGITAGDILVISDCSVATVFQAGPGTAAGAIDHPVLNHAYNSGATVQRLQTVVYYVAPTANANRSGSLSLWSQVAPAYGASTNAVELIAGVDGLAIHYGVDTTLPADGVADRYAAADGVGGLPGGWPQVASARIDLLLASTGKQVTTTPQPYLFDGVAVTPTDHRLRTVMSTTAAVRNYLP